MASIVPYKGKYRAFVAVNGKRRTKVCRTKKEAEMWAHRTYNALIRPHGEPPNKPVSELFDRYEKSVSSGKRGQRWESLRLRRFSQDPIGSVRLPDLSPSHISDWRDRRLKEVSAASVNREWNLMSHVFTKAVKEWGWLPENPMSTVSRPPSTQPRNRLPTQDEIERILHSLGNEGVSGQVGLAFQFALETGMRAGEICRIKPEHISWDKRTVFIPHSKNGTSRTVPLTKRAVEILSETEGDFKLSPSRLDTLFRKARDRAGVEGLTFHDSRRYAATKLAKILDVMTLAKVLGSKDIKILQSVYYAPEISGEMLD